MTAARDNNRVRVHYTGRLEDGTVFDSSRERNPIEFEIGANEVLPAFEDAIKGMDPGDTKTIHLSEQEGFGPFRNELVIEVPKDNFPEDAPLETGQQFQATDNSGRAMILSVVDVADETVTVDANHPLAGKSLTFDLELVEIVA